LNFEYKLLSVGRLFTWLTFIVKTTLRAQIEIPLQVDEGGYITLKVKLNDTDTGTFLPDTGGVNMVSSNLFNKLRPGLKEAGLHTGIPGKEILVRGR
jgi:hypothetical protein